MVEITEIEGKLNELEIFFHKVKEGSKNVADAESASYGLSKIKFIQTALEKYKKKPQNKLLKQIDSGFVSITRGVEYFNDNDTNKKFFELCADIPSLKSSIKW